MIMMYVMHHAFRRDLAAFAARVPTAPVDDADHLARRSQRRWAVFAEVLHKHHSGEDAGLWPLLLERVDAAGEDGGPRSRRWRPSTPRSTRCSTPAPAGFARMASGARRPTTGPRSPSGRWRPRDSLGRHLAHEETDAMVLLQRHLTQADWEECERRSFAKPATPAEVSFAVPWVCLDLPADAREHAFGTAGRGFTVVWLLTRRRFARIQRQAFGS